MLYQIVRPLAIIALKIHFRKIYFSNVDRINWDKPIILAVNHPTSFIEPCVLAAFLPKSLYFLARGDLFKKAFHRALLKSLHILPVFRLKDGGYGKLKNNFATLEQCFDALKAKKTILIMAEGACIQEKRLRPLRKGTARLAFGAYEKYGDLDIQIIPVGVNYTYPDEFRGECMFDFGKPIAVRDYLDSYQQNPNKTFLDLTKELEIRLRKRIVVIDKKEDEELVENLLVIHRNDHKDELLPVVSDSDDRLQQEINIASKVNQLDEVNKQPLAQATKTYFNQLQQLGLSDSGLVNTTFANFSNLLILITGFVPFVIGYYGNFIPMRYARHVARDKVKDVEDQLSVGIAVALVAYLLYYIFLIFLGFFINKISFWIFIILLPLWGFFALMYKSFYEQYKASKKVQQTQESTINDLVTARQQILSNFKSSI